MCPVIKLASLHFNVITLCTGQHYKSVLDVLSLFEIKYDFIFSQKKFNNLSDQLSYYQKCINNVLKTIKIDMMVVHGDTTSCFAGAMSSYFAQIPLSHIEAGLRTHQIYAPFPEEMFRKWTDAAADLCFAPTYLASMNLYNEGKKKSQVFITGNTIVDALYFIQSKKVNNTIDDKLFKLLSKKSGYFLVTLHRNEIRNNKLENIALAICNIALEKNYSIIWPLHPNKNVSQIIKKIAAKQSHVMVCQPMDFQLFVNTMKNADLILTDSGGIQEEASVLGKKIVVIREETERPEILENSTAILAGTDILNIKNAIQKLLNVNDVLPYKNDLFGNGDASEKIVLSIKNYFSCKL